MEKMLDSTQLVSGVAVLLSFLAGYRYGIRNLVDQNKSTEEESIAEERVYSDSNELKMILVVRNDLKMGKGKIGAQCGHAAVGAYQNCMKKFPSLVRRWDDSGSAKIAVKVDSEGELLSIFRAARDRNLNTCLIRDAGRTQIAPNSKTVLAIGPAPTDEIDQITGHLKLL
ncbi:probable peptidyl-tRNA hydrolase 2 [Sitodiplosis mosellana]|uniref:probable peptidyl-tRNA hydrolase 2 n=1 Tax=Sitodiplosis mosellana TaxID=263140 RepID=UPI00244533EC|nr:probable peptidyl-tRNA hydrolase 2 [Sitodiplosis mosellana]